MAIKGVGIDLGTTYSCVAVLTDQGVPTTVPNEEGELSTPSVVFFDGRDIVVGTHAQQNALIHPTRVISHCKRYMGDPRKNWSIDGKHYSPTDVSALILQKLIATVKDQYGAFDSAVITVPAQFNDAQREATIQAGMDAGLEQVSIINEPVAAALCYVLGEEGMWFAELADEQNIYVFDLGGGTLDLAIIRYQGDDVTVVASGGDLHLGGLNFNEILRDAICNDFSSRYRVDPRLDPVSFQELENRVEQLKRSLSARNQAQVICQHEQYRQSYEFTQEHFEKLCHRLLAKTEAHTVGLLKNNKMGWAHINAVLTVGGATRMPMIRKLLKKLSGRTLNTSLSPDQSIAHGAAYFAGMLASDEATAKKYQAKQSPKLARLARMKQTSVNARSLGFLVRHSSNRFRVPHYILPANTPLPANRVQTYGTVIPNQERVKLTLVESGANPDDPYVVLGECLLNNLPKGLPENSDILVTLKYTSEARVEVEAVIKATGATVQTEIIRGKTPLPKPDRPLDLNALRQQPLPEQEDADELIELDPFADLIETAPLADLLPEVTAPANSTSATVSNEESEVIELEPIDMEVAALNLDDIRLLQEEEDEGLSLEADFLIEESERPILLCDQCGHALNAMQQCPVCSPVKTPEQKPKSAKQEQPRKRKRAQPKPAAQQGSGQARKKRPQQRKKRKPS